MFEHRPHQTVGSRQPQPVGESHITRNIGLEIRGQTIPALAGRQLHRATSAGEELLGVMDETALGRAQQPRILQAGGDHAFQPAELRYIAQPAAPLLEIGLQPVRRRPVAFGSL